MGINKEKVIDLIRRLIDDHNTIEKNIIRLLERALKYYRERPDKIYPDIKRNMQGLKLLLELHYDMEEIEIFPLVRDELIEQLIEEHHQVMGIIDDIITPPPRNGDEAPLDPGEVIRVIERLINLIKDHVWKEETLLIQLLKKLYTGGQ